MTNNNQSSVDRLYNELFPKQIDGFSESEWEIIDKAFEQAKAMQQEQAQLYATFVLKCVNNNLPPITFNDWINLENNEQQ